MPKRSMKWSPISSKAEMVAADIQQIEIICIQVKKGFLNDVCANESHYQKTMSGG